MASMLNADRSLDWQVEVKINRLSYSGLRELSYSKPDPGAGEEAPWVKYLPCMKARVQSSELT